MSDQSIVPVTQADRDAAAALTSDEAAAYGMSDLSDAVQTLARHRIAERGACAKVAEEAADDSSDANNEYDGGSGACGYSMACHRVAAAIRARSDRVDIDRSGLAQEVE